ncbi:hypothetical protein LIPSTDRAFT_3676 [Lipomyces starkeyi NRRL Y-11557]|uniref:Uncharacterized protein n=1 Tax=Lipomyces starkeyi NRRL Y-11557 TaxID=675824 RepID=A0A1E3Q872_LIPST|nr:hypothetical protein LIPSTDRAFT_3676 [Lipomyces starkeyi NRRL Y-11557]
MDTLLILEDDLDWNPNLKRTMETLSIQMQDSNIRQTSPSDYERENAPYGLDWDVLYLGSWRHGGHPDFSDIFQKWADPDVPEAAQLNKGKYSNYNALRNFGLTDDEIGKKKGTRPGIFDSENYCICNYATGRPEIIVSTVVHRRFEAW